MERKHYIDNLRWLCILLLIPFHCAMTYNSWGEGNYIILGSDRILSSFLCSIWSWFMPLLFLLAGISARFSISKRSRKQFIAERILKLFVPFVLGTLLLPRYFRIWQIKSITATMAVVLIIMLFSLLNGRIFRVTTVALQ